MITSETSLVQMGPNQSLTVFSIIRAMMTANIGYCYHFLWPINEITNLWKIQTYSFQEHLNVVFVCVNETLFQHHEARHTTWDEDAYNKTHTILQIKPKFVGPLLNSAIT